MSILPNIAIDGPAASGKTTIARMLARELGLVYLDTGAMYRAVTWKSLRQGLDLEAAEAAEAVVELAEGLSMDMEPDPDAAAGHRILVDGVDITPDLHGPDVTAAVPRVASIPGVRREMVRRQKERAAAGGVIMAGRDIGTVVMPEARFKFYLDADLGERARRRLRDLEVEGRGPGHATVVRQLQERDHIDSHRQDSPLRPADDAVPLDCTRLTPDEVVGRILACYRGGRE